MRYGAQTITTPFYPLVSLEISNIKKDKEKKIFFFFLNFYTRIVELETYLSNDTKFIRFLTSIKRDMMPKPSLPHTSRMYHPGSSRRLVCTDPSLVRQATIKNSCYRASQGTGLHYCGIFLPRGSQIAIAIIFLIFKKIKKKIPENIIVITSIIYMVAYFCHEIAR